MDSPSFAFQSVLVDQCIFPQQLEEQKSRRLLTEGLAFSWGGDYSRMLDIIDAVRHGNSVDWSDVHDRCWKCEPVQNSCLLVELLSVCTSPGKVLDALTKENLCALLKKSCPDDSLHIATYVLRYQTHHESAKNDRFLSPYCTAVWMVVCYDKALVQPTDLLERLGPQPDTAVLGAEYPDGGDWRERELVDSLIWASTHPHAGHTHVPQK
jgi:hypothetical protein